MRFAELGLFPCQAPVERGRSDGATAKLRFCPAWVATPAGNVRGRFRGRLVLGVAVAHPVRDEVIALDVSQTALKMGKSCTLACPSSANARPSIPGV